MDLEWSGVPLCNWSPFLENTISPDQRCNRLFNASNLLTLSCPNPHTISQNSQGSLWSSIGEIKQSKGKLHSITLVPACSLSHMKNGQNYSKHVMCRLDNEIPTIASKTESTLNITQTSSIELQPPILQVWGFAQIIEGLHDTTKLRSPWYSMSCFEG